jgi:PAS domain S-box-containing protein
MIRLLSILGFFLALAFPLTAGAGSATTKPKLIVGGDHDCPPYEFLENGEPTGFDIELMRAVADVMGFEAEFRLGPWMKVRQDLEQGRIDALAGMYYSADRSRLVDFSVPHTLVTSGLFVRKDSPTRSYADTQGKEIIVQEGDIIHDALKWNGLASRIVRVTEAEQVLQLLASGKHDCALMPSRLQGEHYIKTLGLTDIRIINTGLPRLQYCFAVRKGSQELLSRLNEGLKILKVNGKYREIHEKWFGVYEEKNLWDAIRYYVLAIAIVAALCLVFIAWSRMLKRLVEQRTAELRRSEEALRFTQYAIDRTLDQAFWMTEDGRFFYVNDAACHTLGYSREELLGMSIPDIDPTHPSEVFAEHWRNLQKHGSVTMESFHRAKDGRVYPVEIRANCVVFDGKEYNCAFATDISERKRMEEELRHARDELEKRVMERTAELRNANELLVEEIAERKQAEEALLLSRFCIDKAGIGIFQSDEHGTIFNVNDHACKSLGYSREELCALSVFDIDPLITRERMVELQEILREKGSVTHYTTHKRSDGTTFPVEITSNNLEFRGKGYGISFVQDITERKRAEEALRDSETRLKMAMDIARLVQWEYDVESGMFTFNDQLYALYGTTVEREGGTLMSAVDYARKFLPPEEAALVAGGLAEVMANASNQLEHRIIRADGEERVMVVRGEAVRDEAGCIVKIRGANQDITERKRMEELLRTSEAAQRKLASQLAQKNNFLRTLIDAIPDLIFYKDCNRAYLGCNRAFEAFAGRQEKDLIGCTDLDFFGRDVAVSFRERDLDILSTEESRRNEEWIAYPDGRRVLLETLKTPYFNLDGEILGVVGVSRDITERKRMEEELLLSHFCINEAAIGIVQVSLDDGKILRVNDYACRSLGYSSDELRATTIFDIDPSLSMEKFCDLKRIACLTGAVTFETSPRRKDGTAFPVEISANILEFQGVSTAFTVFRDISERKRAEEALRESESRVRRKLESILDPESDTGELDLADILDTPEIKALMEDLFRITGLKMSIIDLKGRVLADVGWQDICARFHRNHPETLMKCHESDTDLTVGVPQGEFRTYRCKNNLWHLVTPIIVGGRHMGNLFLGQFFFADERIDFDLFRSQARRYGFPEDEYIAALEAMPRHSEELVNLGKAAFLRLTGMISKLSYANIKLAHSLAERDLLTATLREANLVVENSPAVLFRWRDDDGWPVELVSENIKQFGYAPEDFLAGSITYSSIIYPDDLAGVTREVHDICDGGADQFRLEYRIMTKGGEVRWINKHSHVERDAAGSVKNFEGIVIDVTERKLFEEELQRQKKLLQELNETLERRVGEEVANNREKDIMLIQQNRQAAMGELLDHIAHQWKQPLTVASLLVQNLWASYACNELTAEKIQETIDKTTDLLEHMAQTIEVFRDFYRPDKEKTVFRISDSVDNALAFISPALKYQSIAVEQEVDPGLLATGYPREYIQVLLNVLSNARDALRERNAEKSKIMIRGFAEGSRAVVTIEDNAGGIPEPMVHSIFDLYVTTKEASGGTGIGLHMSKNIIEKNMGGSLTAHNTDSGAQFTIAVNRP